MNSVPIAAGVIDGRHFDTVRYPDDENLIVSSTGVRLE
jgi:hypothetical protein